MRMLLKDVLQKFMQYRKMVEKQTAVAPKRLIFFRGEPFCLYLFHFRRCCTDGVSEGQFQQVLDQGKLSTSCSMSFFDGLVPELPLLQRSFYIYSPFS